MSVEINKAYISLPLRNSEYLTVNQDVTWLSDNPNVIVDNGRVVALEDKLRPDGQVKIQAIGVDGIAECKGTIVNWIANKTNLIDIVSLPVNYTLTKGDGIIYAVNGTELFQSTDNLVSVSKICDLPSVDTRQKILITPFGYFYRSANKVYRSIDLLNWTLSFEGLIGNLQDAHQFDSYYDSDNNTLYIYLAEYSGSPTCNSERHKVYRGTITSESEIWDTILDFYSLDEVQNDYSKQVQWAHHVHLVQVDPYTGHVWVGTGDSGTSSALLYSINNGDTFSWLGLGSQEWRSLALWFTRDYIYWNMDSTEPQKIFRIPRSVYSNGYPSMCPTLINGTTRRGVSYQVLSNVNNRYPVGVGHVYTESEVRIIDSNNSVRPINAPEYDYKEEVITLNNGSLWFVCKVIDETNKEVFLIGGSAEGQIRDWMARVFACWEDEGEPEIQEVLALQSDNPSEYIWESRVYPLIQDDDGYIYLRGNKTDKAGLLRAKITKCVNGHIPLKYDWVSNFKFINPIFTSS